MLSMLWWLPLAVVATAAVPLWWSARALTGEAAKLRVSVDGLAQVRPMVAELKAEIAAVAPQVPGRDAHDLGPR